MSANGAFSTILEYDFFGGGVVYTSGEVSGIIELSLDADVRVPIVGEIQPQTISFALTEAGIETPTIYGSAENLSIDFSMNQSGFIEFGVQRYLTSNANTMIIPFSGSANGYSIVSGTLNQVLSFTPETNIYVFSEGPGFGSISFSVLSKGTNASTHIYDRIGANYCVFDGIEHNEVQIVTQSNDVKIIDNGIRQAEIIQN